MIRILNECQTRFGIDDLDLWREAGLSLDKNGGFSFSGIGSPSSNEGAGKSSQHGVNSRDKVGNGMPEAENALRKDIISNALVWLSSQLCNFIAAGGRFALIPAGGRSEFLQVDELGEYGKSQKPLLEKRKGFAREVVVWFDGSPKRFQPTTRIRSRNVTIDFK